MPGRIILVSDDSNFFEFIRAKLELRKSDELFLFSFDQLKNKHSVIESGVIIFNAENNFDQTLFLIKEFKNLPIIVMTYNEDESFKKKCYRAGATDYMHFLVSDSEFKARMIPALSIATLLEKHNQYKNILIKEQILDANSGAFTSYDEVLDYYLNKIKTKSLQAVLGAISIINCKNQTETMALITKKLRRTDVLMTYAPNKYFLILFNTTAETSEKFWKKNLSSIDPDIYAGFSQITNQTKQQIINEVLNKMHTAISNNKNIATEKQHPLINLNQMDENSDLQYNFKLFKQNFIKNIEKIVTPAFFNIQLKYSEQKYIINTNMQPEKGFWEFELKSKTSINTLKITTPGFTKINIDIECNKDEIIDSKRIALEPNEFEIGLLEDILEQFILECKQHSERNSYDK